MKIGACAAVKTSCVETVLSMAGSASGVKPETLTPRVVLSAEEV